MFLFWGYFPCCASLLIRIHYRVHLMSSSISLRNEITKRRLSMYLSTGLIKLSFGQCVDICLPSCSSYPWCPFRGLYQEHIFPVLHQAYQSPLTPMMVSTSVSLCSFLIALVDCSQHEAALKSESWDFLTIQCPVLVLLKKIYVYNGHACACSQSCLTLCNPMDCSLPGSSVLGVSRQEYWSGLPFPTPVGSSRPRNQTCVSCIAGECFTLVMLYANSVSKYICTVVCLEDCTILEQPCHLFFFSLLLMTLVCFFF